MHEDQSIDKTLKELKATLFSSIVSNTSLLSKRNGEVLGNEPPAKAQKHSEKEESSSEEIGNFLFFVDNLNQLTNLGDEEEEEEEDSAESWDMKQFRQEAPKPNFNYQ